MKRSTYYSRVRLDPNLFYYLDYYCYWCWVVMWNYTGLSGHSLWERLWGRSSKNCSLHKRVGRIPGVLSTGWTMSLPPFTVGGWKWRVVKGRILPQVSENRVFKLTKFLPTLQQEDQIFLPEQEYQRTASDAAALTTLQPQTVISLPDDPACHSTG